MDTQVDIKKFYVVREVLHNKLPISPHWSLPLLGNQPKKFDLVYQTISRWEVPQAGLESIALLARDVHSVSIIPPPKLICGVQYMKTLKNDRLKKTG